MVGSDGVGDPALGIPWRAYRSHCSSTFDPGHAAIEI
jgi:hypothetical protein